MAPRRHLDGYAEQTGVHFRRIGRRNWTDVFQRGERERETLLVLLLLQEERGETGEIARLEEVDDAVAGGGIIDFLGGQVEWLGFSEYRVGVGQRVSLF